MKKVLTLGFLLFAQQANAAWAEHWLFGLSVGYTKQSGEITESISYGFDAPPLIPSQGTTVFEEHIRDGGVFGGIFTGYEMICNHWLLGLELAYDRHDIDREKSIDGTGSFGDLNWDIRTRYKRKNMFDLTGRIGWVWPQLTAYFRLGAEIGRDKLESSFVSDSTLVTQRVITEDFPINQAIEKKRWDGHFMWGVGLEIPFFHFQNVAIRAEYDYHVKTQIINSQEFQNDVTIAANGTTSTGTLLYQNSFQPRLYNSRLTLVWKY